MVDLSVGDVSGAIAAGVFTCKLEVFSLLYKSLGLTFYSTNNSITPDPGSLGCICV
jgi:hypothetical protein